MPKNNPLPREVSLEGASVVEGASSGEDSTGDQVNVQPTDDETVKLSDITPAEILATRDLGGGTISVVTVYGDKFTVVNDG